MNSIRLLIGITAPELENAYREMLSEEKASAVFSTPCEGTAGKSMLGFLGLESNDKVMLMNVTEKKCAARLMDGMVSRLGINIPGNGIAMTIPLSSIGGVSSMKYLMENQNIIIGGDSDMSDKPVYPYDLVVAVTESGCVDIVMGAARTAGAMGGTIIHAKGAMVETVSRFFGKSIAQEKDIVLIATKHADKDVIMKTIMEQAGIHSPAHTAMISLPVESVVGLTSIMYREEEEAGA